MATDARLILEDGTCFVGKSFGAKGEVSGEVVSQTAMVGYQQILTDPSNAGLIICMTYPLIGNYGVNREDYESPRPFLRGLLVREVCSHPNNWRREETLEEFMEKHGVVGICELDTRSITRYLRHKGPLKGVIMTGNSTGSKKISASTAAGRELCPVDEVTTGSSWSLDSGGPGLIVLDLGVKRSLVQALHRRGFRVHVIPARTPAAKIMALKPDGVLIAGGPGSPEEVPADIIQTAADLFGRVPLLGISLGLQVLAMAMGANTVRLNTGHRGDNYPVRDLESGRIYITSQNHGYVVEESSLAPEWVAVYANLHDGTVEGIRHGSYPVWAVQFSPCYSESDNKFQPVMMEDFLEAVKGGKKQKCLVSKRSRKL